MRRPLACALPQVALQRKMFEEYERRERRRKVGELQEVCPDISTEEAEQALVMCDGRCAPIPCQPARPPLGGCVRWWWWWWW